MKLTEDDIQIRFISGASRKIIINSNANFYLAAEKYDFSNESIEDKRHKQLKQQILENEEKANYRDVMIEYSWFQEIIKKGSKWYNETKEKAEKCTQFQILNGELRGQTILLEQEIKQLKVIAQHELTKRQEYEQKLEKIEKIIQMNKNHYEVLRRQNPKLAEEYQDVVKLCNHLLQEILEEKE